MQQHITTLGKMHMSHKMSTSNEKGEGRHNPKRKLEKGREETPGGEGMSMQCPREEKVEEGAAWEKRAWRLGRVEGGN